MSKQVGKSNRSIESFNKEYNTNYKSKPKLKGRNKDYHITEMDNYQQIKDNIEIHQDKSEIN